MELFCTTAFIFILIGRSALFRNSTALSPPDAASRVGPRESSLTLPLLRPIKIKWTKKVAVALKWRGKSWISHASCHFPTPLSFSKTNVQGTDGWKTRVVFFFFFFFLDLAQKGEPAYLLRSRFLITHSIFRSDNFDVACRFTLRFFFYPPPPPPPQRHNLPLSSLSKPKSPPPPSTRAAGGKCLPRSFKVRSTQYDVN